MKILFEKDSKCRSYRWHPLIAAILKNMATEDTSSKDTLGHIFAALLLRLWLGIRALQTGIEKFAGSVSSSEPVKVAGEAYDEDLVEAVSAKAYALENYAGIPAGLRSSFEGEPLLPAWGLKIFDVVLGPALILLGLTILLGIASRASLLVLGLIYVGLTFGLILIKQDAGVAWLGTHMIMIAMALVWSEHNRFTILKKW